MSPRLLRPRATGRFAALRRDLVAYWPLNETADAAENVTATNWVNGGVSLQSFNTVPSIAGKVGNARSFTRANSERLTAGSATGFVANASTTMFGTTNSTVAFWFYPAGDSVSGQTYGLVSNDGFSGPRGASIQIPSSAGGATYPAPTISIFNDPSGSQENNVLFSTTVISKDAWHFICFRRSGTTITGYLNGTAGSSTLTLTGTPFASRGAVHIGHRYGLANGTSSFDNLNGYVDEVAFWSRTLSDDEVATLYNSGAGIDLRR
jgi:hypothetical protein